jgi:fucose 4-O-acetylase-like acetyltransferase
MNNTFIITNRLNWIDWAKVIAISFVVFGHIPQVSGSFPQHYIVTFHMPLFFFISGYLTKKELLNANTLK